MNMGAEVRLNVSEVSVPLIALPKISYIASFAALILVCSEPLGDPVTKILTSTMESPLTRANPDEFVSDSIFIPVAVPLF